MGGHKWNWQQLMGSDPAHYRHNHIYLDGLKSYGKAQSAVFRSTGNTRRILFWNFSVATILASGSFERLLRSGGSAISVLSSQREPWGGLVLSFEVHHLSHAPDRGLADMRCQDMAGVALLLSVWFYLLVFFLARMTLVQDEKQQQTST